MDDDDFNKQARLLLDCLWEMIRFNDRHILIDGEVMEIGEMPAEDLRKPIGESFAASTLSVDLYSIDISKEMEMLFGNGKEKSGEQM